MKKQLKIAGIIIMACLFILPVTVFARGGKDGFRHGRGMRMMTPPAQAPEKILTQEQIKQIEDLHKKFRDKNADILKQLMTKKFDLNTALDSDTPDIAKAKSIQKDISALKGKLAQKHLDLFSELIKIDPKAKFHGGMDRDPKMRGMRGIMGKMEMKSMKGM